MKTIWLTAVVWLSAVAVCYGQTRVQQNTMDFLNDMSSDLDRLDAQGKVPLGKEAHNKAVELGRKLFGADVLWMGTGYTDPLRGKKPIDFQVGDWGCTEADFRIIGRAANGLLLLPLGPEQKVMLLRGVDISKATDGLEIALSHPVVIPETYSYRTVSGAQKIVVVLEVNKERVGEEIAKARAEAEAQKAAQLAAEEARLTRTWTDANGAFSVTAKFVKFANSSVYLLKQDGKEIQVPMSRLSKADQEWVRTELKSRQKPKGTKG